jgi:NAD(P)-dependent dehydrogenase (short-subunit alcohol dehydrogenase family)
MGTGFEGRNVIITGGAGGLGRVVTRTWLAAGAKVLVGEAHQEAISRLQSELGDMKIGAYAGDLTTVEGGEAMIAESRRFFGAPPDTLVHLVGGFAMGPLDAPDAPAQWSKQLALNLQSNFCCYRAILPALKERGGGWIVGMASRVAVEPPAQMTAYAASKAALIAFTRSLAAEVREENIHVNVILASTIDTPANRADMGEKNASKWVRGEDIADATLYLCSERAHAVHGATLEVYGQV